MIQQLETFWNALRFLPQYMEATLVVLFGILLLVIMTAEKVKIMRRDIKDIKTEIYHFTRSLNKYDRQ